MNYASENSSDSSVDRASRSGSTNLLRRAISTVVIGFSLLHHSRPAQAEVTSELGVQLQQALTAEFARSKFTPGASLCVKLPGEGVFTAVAGRNIRGARGRAVTSHDNYRLASMTKTYIATTTLLAAEQNLVTLDASARAYLPPTIRAARIPNGKRVTIRQLLAMRSGIPEYLEQEEFDRRFTRWPYYRWTAAEVIKLTYGARSKFPPGVDYDYSNTNYVMLGSILSRAFRRDLAVLLRQQLFDRLSLHETFLEFEPTRRRLTTHGYEPWGKLAKGGLRNVTAENDGLGLGDGGIISTACDTARFIAALFDERRVLPENLLNQLINFDTASQYGLGVERETTEWGEAWTHNGSSSGYQGQYYYFPSTGVVWVLLTNGFETDLIEPVLERTMPLIREHLR